MDTSSPSPPTAFASTPPPMENLRSSPSKPPHTPSASARRSLLFDTPHRRFLPSSSHSSSSSRTIYSDRFIPSRTGSNFALFDLPSSSRPSDSGGREDGPGNAYTTLLRTVLFGPDHGLPPPPTPDGRSVLAGRTSSSPCSSASSSPFDTPSRNIFRFKAEVPRHSVSPLAGFEDDLSGVAPAGLKLPRKVQPSPYRVLDAPALQDDFYLNLVDWSSQNVLAVALGSAVYLWSGCSGKVTKLCNLGEDSVCSVCWAQRGNHLAVGTNQGKVQIWDTSRCRRIRTMEGHRRRVGALSWSSSVLSSGGRDKKILQRDIRAQDDFVSKLSGHKSEVCGLKWSYDNHELASGGNDNRLLVWNQHSTQPVLKYCEHIAAVKAIAWSPHQRGLLASGGGTADRCIRFWNTTTDSYLSGMNTGSQVCNLIWSKNVDELVSTHGYSQNQIIVWQYPTMLKVATLTAHTYRVLYLAASPDGQTIVTGAGDETLRFWNVFPSLSSKFKVNGNNFGASSLGRTYIR